MNKRFLLLMMLMPFIALAQDESAIKWADGVTWQQVKQKAKKENKYIFVDCFTTWCGPCKKMDKDVYTIDSVGSFFDAGFISVRLQMDSTKDDNGAIRSWYKTAKAFEKGYNINAYPTLLFFTPAGEMAAKEIGYREASALLTVAKNAKDPSKQYYVLVNNYKKGKKDYRNMPSLFNLAYQLHDTDTYRAVRDDYYAHLHSLSKEKLYTKENIEFVAASISRSSQVVFDMFYPDGSAVDKVMGKNGYARKVVDDVIMKEKIAPVLNAALESKIQPDWTMLYKSIAKDYNSDYTNRNVLNAKIAWHRTDSNHLIFATFLNDKMEQYGSDTTSYGEDFKLNNIAYQLWQELTDSVQLKRIANWMKGVVDRGQRAKGEYTAYGPLYMDTYANLLYKVGERQEALKWQEFALTKAKELNIDNGDISTIEGNLELMRKGQRTW